jgi:hypothetical protein
MTESEWLASDDPAAMLRAVGETDGDHPDRTFYGQAPHRASPRKLRLWVEACRDRANPGDTSWNDLDRPGELEECVRCWARENGWQQQLPSAARAALLRDIVGNPFLPVWEPKRHMEMAPPQPYLLFNPEWRAPQVLSLAQVAYDERPGRECEKCEGTGEVPSYTGMYRLGSDPCKACVKGRIDDGSLDPLTLLALADALEEAGCDCEEEEEITCPACNGAGQVGTLVGTFGCVVCSRNYKSRGTGKQKVKRPHPLLAHLRSGDPHVRGCWAVDLILGRC